MARLRIGNFIFGGRRKAALTPYDYEDPYMPGGNLPERYSEPYDDGPYDEDYDGDYVYDDGPYDEDYGYDDAPYDEGYAYEGPYDGDYDYDYGPYDDGYGDGYGYDEPYDDMGYSGEPPYYGDEYPEELPAYPRGALGEALRYADENDWVTMALLVLLPPLGIWLLWRRQRYNRNATQLLSAVSALWCVAVVVLLFAQPFRGRSDTTITPQQVGARPAVEGEADAEEAEPEQPASVIISDEEVDEANAVYVTQSGNFYHRQNSCAALPANETVSRVSQNTAIDLRLLACPYCMAGQYSDGTWDLTFVTAETTDESGILVYCSPYNTHFHTDGACSDIGGDARQVGLKEALLMGRSACDICCASAGRMIYCTLDGTYYHIVSDCSGMRNASRVTYAEARVTGKRRCPTCIGGVDETEEQAASANGAAYYVYATAKGRYYHIEPNCSGMQNAQRVPLSDMLKSNRPACPVCCADVERIVYTQQGEPYYHSYDTCSGMTAATQGTLVNALALGYQRCPVCWTVSN